MFTLYKRDDVRRGRGLNPEDYPLIFTPRAALIRAQDTYDLDPKSYRNFGVFDIPNRLYSRHAPSLFYDIRGNYSAIHNTISRALEYGYVIGIGRMTHWSTIDNPFYVNQNGDLVCECVARYQASYIEAVMTGYKNAVQAKNGVKASPTRRNTYSVPAPQQASTGGQTINSRTAGALLAAGGVYNGNIAGYKQTAEQLGGEATEGYNAVLNEKTAGLAIAAASMLAAINPEGSAGELAEVEELGKTQQVLNADRIGNYDPVGRSGNPLSTQGYNTAAVINDVSYSAHAIDRMQGRGFTPSSVENAIQTGTIYPTKDGTTGYYDSVNNIRVITNSDSGHVVTVIPGAPN